MSEERIILPEEVRKNKKIRRVYSPLYRQLVINLVKALGIVIAGALIILLTEYGYMIGGIFNKFSGLSTSEMTISQAAILGKYKIVKLYLEPLSYTVELKLKKCRINSTKCEYALVVYGKEKSQREYYLICSNKTCIYYLVVIASPSICLVSVNGTRIAVKKVSSLTLPIVYYCNITSTVPHGAGFCVICNVGKLKNVEMCFSNVGILNRVFFRNGTYIYSMSIVNVISPKVYVSPQDILEFLRKK